MTLGPSGLYYAQLRKAGWLSPAEAEELRDRAAGWEKSFDRVAKDRDEQRARADKAEQQAAAMREALGNAIQSARQSHINHCGPWEKYGRHAPECYADEVEEYEAALATDVGRGFVRAERLKEVLIALNVTRDKVGLQTWIACGLEGSRDLLASLLRDAGGGR